VADFDEEEMMMRARARARAAGAGGAAPAPKPGPFGNGVAQTIDDSVSGVASGIPFSDEIEAGMAAPFRAIARKVKAGDWSAPGLDDFGDAYNTEVEGLRKRRADASERSPVATTVGQVAGGLITMGRGSAPAATWGGRALQAGRDTAIYGGLQGAGEGEGFEDRVKKGAGGALVGGATGLVASPVAEGVVKGVQTQIAPRIRSVFKPNEEAARRVGLAIGKDRKITGGNELPARGLTDKEFAASEFPDELTNMERGSHYTRSLADSAATNSPGARNMLHERLHDRSQTQFSRTSTLLDEMTPGDTEAVREGLLARARNVNDPAYDAAHAHPKAQMMWDGELEHLAQADIVRSAMKEAVRTGTNAAVRQGQKPIRHPFSIDSTGELHLANPNVAPNLAFWDRVKRKMDDAIGKLKRDGAKDAVAEATDIKRQLVEHIDGLVPDYKVARKGAAGFIGAENALDAGADLVNKKIDPALAFKMYGKMNPAERELAKIGIVNALKKRLGDVKDVNDLTKHIFSDPNSRARLGVFLGDKNMGRLGQHLKEETLMQMTKNQVTGGSPTARRLKESALVGLGGGALYGGATGDYDLGHMAQFGGALGAARFGGKLAVHKFEDRMAMKIAEKLLSNNPATYREASRLLAQNPHLLGAVRAMTAPLGVYGAQKGARSF
jgi:hypothetical protein